METLVGFDQTVKILQNIVFVTSQIKRAAIEGKKVDPMNLLRVGGPPSPKRSTVTPDHSNAGRTETLGKDFAVVVEPIIPDRFRFGRMPIDSQIANRFIADRFSVQNQ